MAQDRLHNLQWLAIQLWHRVHPQTAMISIPLQRPYGWHSHHRHRSGDQLLAPKKSVSRWCGFAARASRFGRGVCLDGLLQAGFEASSKHAFCEPASAPKGAFGYAAELSTGKDTPSGHWEMAGVPVLFDWGYFLDKTNSFEEHINEYKKID
mgnify:CR=1 FL=1